MIGSAIKWMLLLGLVLCAQIWSAPVLAQQDKPSVSASVDASQVAVGDSVTYTLRVEAPGRTQIGVTKAPRFGTFTLRGKRQGTEFRSVNGKASLVYNYQFMLQATKKGQAIIQGAQVKVGARVLPVPAVKIKVLPAGKKPKADPNKGKSVKGIMLEAQVSTKEPFVGQQVQLTYNLILDEREVGPFGLDVRDIKSPGFDGFWIEDLSTGVQVSPRRTRIKGRDHTVRPVQMLAIFPLESGEVTIDPMNMEVNASMRFARGRNRARLSSAPVKLKVRDLPSGAPSGFHRGNVGKFRFRAEIDKKRVAVGEAFTLRLEAKGQGMINRVELPTLPTSKKWRQLEPVFRKNQGRLRNSSRRPEDLQLGGEKVAEIVVTPVEEGTLVLPALSFHYFDPDLGRYKTLTSKPQTLDVVGKAAPVPQQDVKLVERNKNEASGAVQTAKQPLRSVRASEGGSEAFSNPASNPLFWLGILLPPLFFLGWIVGGRWRQNRAASAPERARAGAPAQARRGLDEADALAGQGKDAEAAAATYQALTHFLASKFEVSPGAITSSRLKRLLPEAKIEQTILDRLLALRADCESARFGGLEVPAAQLVKEARALLKALGGEP